MCIMYGFNHTETSTVTTFTMTGRTVWGKRIKTHAFICKTIQTVLLRQKQTK